MISKTMIGIILASTVGTSAMVYAGIAHRRHQPNAALAATSTTGPQSAQPPAIPKPPAGKPFDPAADANQDDAANDPNAPAQQSSDSADDSNQNQASADGQPDAGDSNRDSNQAPVPTVRAQRQTAPYAVAARVQPVARVKVRPVVHPVVEATSVSVDRPVASVESALPSAVIVPTGTELTVRLAEPLGSKISHANQSFSAILDRDVDVRGLTAIPAGARATGKVVFARLAGRFAGEANLQLEIDSIKINRHEFAIWTSIRSFGPIVQAKNKVGRFIKGIAKRMDGEEHDVLLDEQTAYAFSLSRPLEIQ
jgi:hypothetical protein